MRLIKLVKPMLTACLLPLAISANANAFDAVSKDALEYNFVDVKASFVQPTKSGNNSGLNAGDTTYAGSLAVGRKFMDAYTASVEFSHRGKNSASSYSLDGNQFNNWKVQAETLMAVFTADLVKESVVRPYVVAGLGVSRNKASSYVRTLNDESGVTNTYAGKTTNSFAWKAGAGLSMATHQMFDTTLEYTFVNRGKMKTKENFTNSLTGLTTTSAAKTGKMVEHVFSIGLRVKF